MQSAKRQKTNLLSKNQRKNSLPLLEAVASWPRLTPAITLEDRRTDRQTDGFGGIVLKSGKYFRAASPDEVVRANNDANFVTPHSACTHFDAMQAFSSRGTSTQARLENYPN